jgi:hypothetical protein
MRGKLDASSLAAFLRCRWRWIVGGCLAAAGLYVAITLSDEQGRADLPSGYAVRMTCENDPESYLWSGGCERIAGDIARTDIPSFAERYRAFVTVHHRAIPSTATQQRFAKVPAMPGSLGETLRVRASSFPESFRRVPRACTRYHDDRHETARF